MMYYLLIVVGLLGAAVHSDERRLLQDDIEATDAVDAIFDALDGIATTDDSADDDTGALCTRQPDSESLSAILRTCTPHRWIWRDEWRGRLRLCWSTHRRGGRHVRRDVGAGLLCSSGSLRDCHWS